MKYSFRFVTGFSIILVLSLTFIFSSFAHANNDHKKYYTSVCVENGQTLWDISGKYCSAEYRDRDEYIDEVMQLNHLTSANIHSGSYLVIPYYASEPL